MRFFPFILEVQTKLAVSQRNKIHCPEKCPIFSNKDAFFRVLSRYPQSSYYYIFTGFKQLNYSSS